MVHQPLEEGLLNVTLHLKQLFLFAVGCVFFTGRAPGRPKDTASMSSTCLRQQKQHPSEDNASVVPPHKFYHLSEMNSLGARLKQ